MITSMEKEKKEKELQAYIEEINEKNLKKLSDKVNRDEIIPFIGAGMSCPIYGIWKEYLQSILPPFDEDGHEILKKKLKEGQYEDAAQWICEQYGIEFYNRTAEYFDEIKIKKELISQATQLLPYLFQGPIITTNLDRIIEYIYREEGISVTTALANDPELVQAMTRDKELCLWKIHGDIKNRKSWVLTKDDYIRTYHSGEGFQQCLEQILQNRVLLFLGYSLESDMIVNILEKLCQHNPYVMHFAILPAKEEYFSGADGRKLFTMRCQQLGRMGVNPIWYPEGKYNKITQYLESLLKKYPLALRRDLDVKKKTD